MTVVCQVVSLRLKWEDMDRMIGGPCLLALEEMNRVVSLSFQGHVIEEQTAKDKETRTTQQQRLGSCEIE